MVLVLSLPHQGYTRQAHAKNELRTKSADLNYHRPSLYRESLAVPPTCRASSLTTARPSCIRVRATERHECFKVRVRHVRTTEWSEQDWRCQHYQLTFLEHEQQVTATEPYICLADKGYQQVSFQGHVGLEPAIPIWCLGPVEPKLHDRNLHLLRCNWYRWHATDHARNQNLELISTFVWRRLQRCDVLLSLNILFVQLNKIGIKVRNTIPEILQGVPSWRRGSGAGFDTPSRNRGRGRW